MNEDEIVQQLASKTASEASKPYEPREEESGQKTPQPESGEEPKTLDDPFQKIFLKQQLLSHFDTRITPGNFADEKAINNIVDFVQQETQTQDIGRILQYINSIERELGIALKSGRLQRFNQFVTIRSQMRMLRAKEEAMRG